ncbi:MAG: hypothetical protein A2X47_06840 [Lentisphaerae bacterium GWF2_38_69]|nr:MAG: hypothetical protein A2X47_06840 [Lentisphaerae bacterium GWF2_38_69]
MTIPAIKCLHKISPIESSLYVITNDNLKPLFDSIEFIKGTINVGDGHSKWRPEIVREIKALNPGLGFLFVDTFRSAWYLKKCVPKLFGASNGLRDFLLTKTFQIKWHEKKSCADEHQIYKYLNPIYLLGGNIWDGKYPKFKIISDSEVKDQRTVNFIKKGKILVVAPGAAYGSAKKWSAENYNTICDYWIKKEFGKVVILGTKNEIDSANIVSNGLDQAKVLNLAGKTNLKELIYILKNSNLCICNDSGIMHLGSVLDIKGITIFGSTDPQATGPLSKNWKVLIKKQDCAPCFLRECVNHDKDYLCLKSITTEEVIKTINETII